MPNGSSARKLNPNASDNNRSSSNAKKRRDYSPIAANDNSNLQKKAPEINLERIAPKSKLTPPSPTGSASATPVKDGKRKTTTSHSIGPEAIARPVSQNQLAAQLGSDQQRARNDNNLDQTREEMLAETGDASSTVLPGQYNPLTDNSAYSQKATTPPGSMAEPSPSKDLDKEGGAMQSDLERQRAMQMEHDKMSATRSQAGAGTATTLGASSQEQPSSEQQTESTATEATPASQASAGMFPGGQAPTGKGTAETAKAQQFAQAIGAERTAKTLQTVQSARGNVQAARKAAKTAKTLWNLIKTGELAAGITVVSLIVLFITANLQMINKYTLKSKIIPETYLLEDFTYLCMDCLLCGSACFSALTSTSLIWLLLAGLMMLTGFVFGLDYFGVLELFGYSL